MENTITYYNNTIVSVVYGQRLDLLSAKIKFIEIRVLLHFALKNGKLACEMGRDSVPKNSASIADTVSAS